MVNEGDWNKIRKGETGRETGDDRGVHKRIWYSLPEDEVRYYESHRDIPGVGNG